MATTRSRLGRALPMAIALTLPAVTFFVTSVQAADKTVKIRRLGNPSKSPSSAIRTTAAPPWRC